MKYLIILFFYFLTFLSQAQSLEYGREITNKLASDEFYGRGYLNDGHLKAATFLADEFKRLGLKPLKSSYFQSFEMSVNTYPEPLFLKINGELQEPGKDYLVNPESPTSSGKCSATSIKVKSRMEINYSGRLGKRKALVIDFSEANRKDKYELLAYYKSDRIPEQPLITLENDMLWRLSPYQEAKAHFLLMRDSFPEQISKIEYQITCKTDTFISNNVIGFIEGKTQPDSFLIVCGHYDHLGMMGEKAIFNGANDNASGVAMVLDLAQYFAKPENQPNYSMLFIAFGGEEAGLLGSKFFVENSPIDLNKIRFVLNIDLMGTGGLGITIVNAPNHLEEYNFLNNRNEIEYKLPIIKKRSNTKNSDHFPFTEKNVPAFFVYAMGAWTFYHDTEDRPEQLPLTKYVEITSLFRDFLIDLQK